VLTALVLCFLTVFLPAGDFIVFDTSFLPFSQSLWPLISVTYGLYGQDLSTFRPCSNLALFSDSSLNSTFPYPGASGNLNVRAVRCLTGPGGGDGFVFSLLALNARALPSNDTYNYPGGAPVVDRVYGCSSLDTATGAAGCPTAGGVTVTLAGRNLCRRTDTDCAMTVFVGTPSQRCTNVRLSENALSLTCTLPVGRFLLS
jgi:hypothetical protein